MRVCVSKGSGSVAVKILTLSFSDLILHTSDSLTKVNENRDPGKG